jgi:HSP20 family protein
MALPTVFRRNRGRSVPARREDNPFVALQRDMNRLFEPFWRNFDLPNPFEADEAWRAFTPHMDIEETDTEVRVTAELPGLEERDFEVHVTDDALVLKGEKREEHEDPARGWRERSYGRFERSIPLPYEVDADRASAQFKNGVLTVRLPKSPTARERSKRVHITAS